MTTSLPTSIRASSRDLPEAVAAAVGAPAAGKRVVTSAGGSPFPDIPFPDIPFPGIPFPGIPFPGIPFSALTWGDPSARPLVLLHGVTASAAIWWRVGPAMAATGRYVVAPDLPGHGRTGHWAGRPRFPDMATDIAAWIRAAGLDRHDLQVVGHSYGAMIAAHLPTAGLRPASIVLLDPPTLPLEFMVRQAEDPSERTYDDLPEAAAAVTAAEPRWSPGDVRAKAEALTELDEIAARAIVLDNGDWDGGLAGISDPAAAGVDIWVVKGEQAAGSYLLDTALPAFRALLGADHILTIRGGPHSPQRMMIEATLVALIRALG